MEDAISAVERVLILHDSWRSKTSLTYWNVIKLLRFCLETTHFIYQGKFYQQSHGCAMGSPISPIVANIFMEDFEEFAFTPLEPELWLRYVDDTFVIINQESVAPFMEHINSINDHIKFTHEVESEGSIPFLDVLVTRDSEGHLTTSVYRKPTHTDQYLSYASHHPSHQKLGVVRTLASRADDITSNPEIL